MFSALLNAWKIPELRKKIIFTLMMIGVFRLGSHIPVPGINKDLLSSMFTSDLFTWMNILSGGSFKSLTVFAMGIIPYINASIIVQLLTMVVTYFERLAKEGEEGRKKISRYTRYAALILAVVWSLRIIGADINGIIAGLGILALIIGMSAEGIIEDMTTGIFMLFEQEFKVGDIIEVDDFAGRVSEIGIRTTTLIDNAGNEKIFNNSSLKDVLNRSAHLSKAVVDIELADGVDVNKVINADYGDIVCLGLEEINPDSVTIRFVKETEEKDIYDKIDILNRILWDERALRPSIEAWLSNFKA